MVETRNIFRFSFTCATLRHLNSKPNCALAMATRKIKQYCNFDNNGVNWDLKKMRNGQNNADKTIRQLFMKNMHVKQSGYL